MKWLLSAGFAIECETWSATFKGIDDLLTAGQTPDLLTGDVALQMISDNAAALGVNVAESQPVEKTAPTAKTRRMVSAQTKSEFQSAKAKIDLAALLNRHVGRSRGRKWHCPFHEGKGLTLSIFRDRLDIARYRCFHPDCDSSGDAIDLLTRHCGLSFSQACDELGLPMPAKSSVTEPDEKPSQPAEVVRKHAEVHAWLLEDCRYRGRCVVLVRPNSPNQLFNVFPPCGSRYKCPYCRREWERERIERFNLGIDQFAIADDRVESLFDLDREFFFAATLPPQHWHTTRQRLRRRAKKSGRPLLFAAVETHDLGGEP